MKKPPFPRPDWWEQNDSDGCEFFGYDNENGSTSWYLPDGSYDCDTRTPSEDADAWKIWEGLLKHLSR